MKPFIDKLSFSHLLWLIPITFTIHNAEEIPNLEPLIHLPVNESPFLNSLLPITTDQFSIAAIFFTSLVFIFTYLGSKSRMNGFGIYLLICMQFIVFLNSVTHIFSSLLFFKYSSGVISAVLINIPFSLYLFRRAFQEGAIRKKNFAYAFVSSLILYPAIAGLSLTLSKAITN